MKKIVRKTFTNFFFEILMIILFWACESPLLELDRHHRDYELSVDLRFCEFKAIETGRERFKFGAADCEAIRKELGSIDWHGMFSRKSVDQCTDLFYDVIWSFFVVLYRRPRCIVSKSFRGSKDLNGLKNRAIRAVKKRKKTRTGNIMEHIRNIMGMFTMIIVLASRSHQN
jgi:hypothetical protein